MYRVLLVFFFIEVKSDFLEVFDLSFEEGRFLIGNNGYRENYKLKEII